MKEKEEIILCLEELLAELKEETSISRRQAILEERAQLLKELALLSGTENQQSKG
jgi:hypothetical protein